MERLVDKQLTATVFEPRAQDGPLPAQARTVVIGAGIIGTSVAFHLAESGDCDVLVLDRNVIGSGTTWHAAGLASGLRATPTLSGLAGYGIRTYRRLGADSGMDVNFNQCGSLQLARTPGRLDELRYAVSVARQLGVPAHVVSPSQIGELWPLASTAGLLGGVHLPEDGHVNPGHVAMAFAKLAHARGVAVREGVSVSGIQTEDGAAAAVVTSHGIVRCERVVLAAGLWSRDLAAACGVSLPLYAAEHVHVRTEPVEGAEPTLPVLRDLDGYFYVRHERGRLLVGAFEPDGLPRRVEEISTEGFAEFPPAWEHFAPVRRNAEERVPVLRSRGYDRFLNAPEAFTPDGAFCLGETAEVANLFVAAGFNSQGIIYGPGAGRALAAWMTRGGPDFDVSAVDVRRFARQQSNRRYLHARTAELLGGLYAMHWPHLQPVTARGVRRTPLHDRLAAAGACFGETTGWERANWFAPAGTRPRYEYSYGRQNWFEQVGREHRAARQAVALFDLSSFTKAEIAGPDATQVLQRFCTADVDLPVGRVRYTLMLNPAGGIDLDGTVVRLDTDRFWVITPAAAQHKTLGLLRRLARGRAAAVFDATAGYATIAVMGPNSRQLLSRISPQDWSNQAQPFGHAREVELADGYAWSVRVSFVGELGYELYPTAEQAVNLYDALLQAGSDLGVRHAGYHALDSLRSEKGYRHLGHDIGPHDDPFTAGLGFAVSRRKLHGPPAECPAGLPGADDAHWFIGRDALEKRTGTPPRRRAVHVALRDPGPVFVHDETILCDGRVVGRMTSGSYGYTIGRACGLGYVRADAPGDGAYTVDCGGYEYRADISVTPFYDPANHRLKS